MTDRRFFRANGRIGHDSLQGQVTDRPLTAGTTLRGAREWLPTAAGEEAPSLRAERSPPATRLKSWISCAVLG